MDGTITFSHFLWGFIVFIALLFICFLVLLWYHFNIVHRYQKKVVELQSKYQYIAAHSPMTSNISNSMLSTPKCNHCQCMTHQMPSALYPNINNNMTHIKSFSIDSPMHTPRQSTEMDAFQKRELHNVILHEQKENDSIDTDLSLDSEETNANNTMDKQPIAMTFSNENDTLSLDETAAYSNTNTVFSQTELTDLSLKQVLTDVHTETILSNELKKVLSDFYSESETIASQPLKFALGEHNDTLSLAEPTLVEYSHTKTNTMHTQQLKIVVDKFIE